MVSEIRAGKALWLLLLAVIVILAAFTSFVPVVSVGFFLVFLVFGGAVLIFRQPNWTVLFLVIYMPFESFILSKLPVSDQLYLALQFFSELLIYGTFVLVMVKRFLQRPVFPRTAVDVPIILLLVIILASILVNQVPTWGSLLNFRSLFRYVVLFYLVVNLNLTRKWASRILLAILVTGIIQILLGGLQLMNVGAVDTFLLPRLSEAEIIGQTRSFHLVARGREIGSIYGTLGDTLYYGLFLLVVLAVYLGRITRIKMPQMLFITAVFLAINYSYSRAAVFAMLLMLLVFFRIRFGLGRTAVVAFYGLTAGIIIFLFLFISASRSSYVNPADRQQNVLQNLSGIFSPTYFEIAQKQRLGMLLGVTPTVLANKPFLGYGPDNEETIKRINESNPSFLLTPLQGRTAAGFEDVYWIAFLAYHGILGLVTLAYIHLKFYQFGWYTYRRTEVVVIRKLAVAVMCLVATTPLLLFFNQTLEFRIYGFYFWLLPALLMNLYAQERKGELQPQAGRELNGTT